MPSRPPLSAVAGPRLLARVWGRRTECVPGAEQGELRGGQESQREEMILADGRDQQSGGTTFYFCLSLEK